MLYPEIIGRSCVGFWWTYKIMKKVTEKARNDHVKGNIKVVKNLVKKLDWKF